MLSMTHHHLPMQLFMNGRCFLHHLSHQQGIHEAIYKGQQHASLKGGGIPLNTQHTQEREEESAASAACCTCSSSNNKKRARIKHDRAATGVKIISQ